MHKYHLQGVPSERTSQRSFHVASEGHVRIEFMRIDREQTFGPLRYRGDVVITCVDGLVKVAGLQLGELEQCVVAEGNELRLAGCSSTATIQMIWCPPFAVTEQLDHASEPTD